MTDLYHLVSCLEIKTKLSSLLFRKDIQQLITSPEWIGGDAIILLNLLPVMSLEFEKELDSPKSGETRDQIVFLKRLIMRNVS